MATAPVSQLSQGVPHDQGNAPANQMVYGKDRALIRDPHSWPQCRPACSMSIHS
ncbi:hypothetical protein N9E38_01645 [Yoonia sp.]|nr:hypothetical protein [Yoonia sp.]MDC1399778.1 hypothetical protein [Yoonia sp.]